MPFNPDTFVSSVANYGGLMRTNKFRFWFTLPTCFQGDPNLATYQQLTRDAELWADQAQWPGTTQQTMKFRRYGYGPLDTAVIAPLFEDVPIRFIADGTGLYWALFNEWMSKAVPKSGQGPMNADQVEVSNTQPLSPYETGWQYSYETTMNVSGYNDAGDEVMRAVINQGYPTAVSEIKFDWGDGGDAARFMVNMNMQDWYIVPVPSN